MPNNHNLEEDNQQLFFVKKSELLKNVNNIYESLIDITCEIETTNEHLKRIKEENNCLKLNIRHLKNMIQKDMILKEQPKQTSINLNAIKMSLEQWNEYINRSSTASLNNSNQNSDNNSYSTGENKMSSITTSNK